MEVFQNSLSDTFLSFVFYCQELRTNALRYRSGTFRDQSIIGVKQQKGSAFGEFNLGSTIVLIFEAPSDLECCVEYGQRVKYGERLFDTPAGRKSVDAKG